MADPQQRLPLHLHVVGKQQVKMLEHRARQAVFDGDSRGIHGARDERGKHLGRKRARHNLRARHKLQRRFMAE
jgi:hypothetical protein